MVDSGISPNCEKKRGQIIGLHKLAEIHFHLPWESIRP